MAGGKNDVLPTIIIVAIVAAVGLVSIFINRSESYQNSLRTSSFVSSGVAGDANTIGEGFIKINENLCEEDDADTCSEDCISGMENDCHSCPLSGVFKKGTTTIARRGLSFTDYCLSYDTLQEYSCRPFSRIPSVDSFQVSCGSYYTSTPMICKDGKCALPPCGEDDDGRNPIKQGTTIGYSRDLNKESSWKDYCESPNVLVEYYCSSEGVKADKLTCKFFCNPSTGTCIEPPTMPGLIWPFDIWTIVSSIVPFL